MYTHTVTCPRLWYAELFLFKPVQPHLVVSRQDKQSNRYNRSMSCGWYRELYLIDGSVQRSGSVSVKAMTVLFVP